jgi:predicted dienelactone hydrolase
MNNKIASLTRLAQQVCAASLLLAASAIQAQVGMRTIDSGGMPITLVYPTAAPVQPVISGPFTIQAAVNAAPLPAEPASRRLIVLSHGTAGSALPDHELAATLARAGFVVAQPLHGGDNHKDFSRAGPESWLTRPQEVTQTIDALAQDALLGPQLDLRRVGVHGMSAGGVTGLVLAGAQWRMLDVVTHCAQNLQEDIGFCLNGLAQQPVQQAIRKSQYMLARALNEGNAPARMKTLHGGKSPGDASAGPAEPRPDPRVAAVSLLVPLSAVFTAESLARITIPVGLTTAGSDQVLLPRFHSQRVLQHCKTCVTLSDHPEAGHFDWLAPWPQALAQTLASTQMRGGLPNAGFSAAERQNAFDQIAVFFKKMP